MSADEKTERKNAETTHDVEPTDGVEIDKVEDQHVESAEDTEDTEVAEDGVPRRQRVKVLPTVLVVLILISVLLVSAALPVWLYFTQYRPDEQTDTAAAQAVVRAAREGTVALLSYKPDTLNQDFAAAKSHLTGDFLNYYDEFTEQIVTPAAKEKAVTTTAQVLTAGTSELHPTSAVVLVFVNQVTTSRDRPDPAMQASSVSVSLTKVDGKWLITKFDPV
jgi:Mce-associated membrane protein